MNRGDRIMKHVRWLLLITGVLLALSARAEPPLATVPEPFSGFDPASIYTIKYDDVDAFLRAAVIDTGRSNREKAEPDQAKTGTRMKVKVKRSTINEGNRFVYEAFEGDDNAPNREMLKAMRQSLEQIPTAAPLKLFSRDEQLAYWLNLYNITLLDEIVAIYPKRNLKKVVTGKNSILAQKVLNVAGVPLSLDDIQHTILRQNYDNNRLVLYGLYQGHIGSPNIRKQAYTGQRVWYQLEDNAKDFVNSNRGTEGYEGDKAFKVSTFYERSAAYFPDFQQDLRAHLFVFLEGPELQALKAASELDPDIDDWTVTDLYGSYDSIGGSFADNNAALVDSIQNISRGANGLYSSNFSAAYSQAVTRAPDLSRFSPQLAELLKEIQVREERANEQKQGIVTVEEMGQAAEPEEPKEEP
jgi:hypothetical protein